ncbi:MAG TPA: TIGR03087 family PEP-CTERM/XrtA system glycosyltransferase [Planctomycetota bacterium]|nr:TIGR03087 family PEP-CTERM/XrtA system glycosyltransferase [Planctomycetota bacterium]
MRILFLSQRVPYPPNRGDKITTWRLVDRMRRKHDVTCVAFAHDAVDLQAARELDAMGIPTLPVRHRDAWKRIRSAPLLLSSSPLTLGVYGSRKLQSVVDRLMPQMDLAYAYSSSMGAFLEKHPAKPRIMHFGELDSDKWRQYSEFAGFPMRQVYARESRTLLEFERRIANAFTENVLCTPLEQRIFQEKIPGAPSVVLRNGVDLNYYRPGGTEPWPGHIVFTGVMNYFPNVDGCRFFVEEVFPLVRKEFPRARFTIVGAHPAPEIRRLGRTIGVSVTGYVHDTRKILRTAAVSVAPLRIARGIQNKVLEALSMGIPVVGTSAAVQGVDGVAGRDYLVGDDAETFAEAVCSLLRDPQSAHERGLRGRRFVEDTYDWEVVFRPLDALLEDCASAGLAAV